MERFITKMLCTSALILMLGCSANTAPGGKEDLYSARGMEITKVVSNMADVVLQTMVQDIQIEREGDAIAARKSFDKDVKLSALPKVAITSFVDTDTYENAGYLGRSVAEMFIHELDRRGVSIFEYKLTGSLSITKDGEFVFSRNWKKLARQAMVKHILAGTLTRNDKGIVLNARVINMMNQTVVGSATGFIPYERLPMCYRTGEKNCSINGVNSYYQTEDGKVIVSGSTSTETLSYEERQKRAEQRFIENGYHDNDFNDKYYVTGAKVPGTSTGNYERFRFNKKNGSWASVGVNPVIYPAQTYQYQGKLVRDVHDESQYSRTGD